MAKASLLVNGVCLCPQRGGVCAGAFLQLGPALRELALCHEGHRAPTTLCKGTWALGTGSLSLQFHNQELLCRASGEASVRSGLAPASGPGAGGAPPSAGSQTPAGRSSFSPNNYTIQKLKSCLCCFGSTAVEGRPMGSFACPTPGSEDSGPRLCHTWGSGVGAGVVYPLRASQVPQSRLSPCHTVSTKACGFSGCDQLATADSSGMCYF